MNLKDDSKVALMVCTQARGGMLSVVEAYERDGIFQRWGFEFLWTHREGGIGLRLAVALKAYLRLLQLLIRDRVSFVHIHAAMRGSFWRKSIVAEIARRFSVPTILHLHGSEMKTFYGSLSPLRQWAVRRSLEKADAVVVLSDSWRKFVLGVAPKARITVINNYVSLPTGVSQTKRERGFNVLFLGVLGPRKGIYDLLDCWPEIVLAVPGARLLIGGNGEIETVRERVKALGIVGSVDLLGWVGGNQKLELLRNTDAFVLPSYNEGLPMSVLEAMSWGKPVVTTRVGGIPELVTHGRDGLLIDAGDKSALAEALIHLGLDPEYRSEIGTAGRQRIEDSFSDVSVLPRLESVYRQVLGQDNGNSAAGNRPVVRPDPL